jgi:hypothetical protein
MIDVYSIICTDNPYWPHMEIITRSRQNDIWVWTIAKSISYSTDTSGTLTLLAEFPETFSHYMILKNVEQFSAIEIYDMRFRTDPRFESYNSSGYVYDESTKTLLMKFRHKTEIEKVRLFYN